MLAQSQSIDHSMPKRRQINSFIQSCLYGIFMHGHFVRSPNQVDLWKLWSDSQFFTIYVINLQLEIETNLYLFPPNPNQSCPFIMGSALCSSSGLSSPSQRDSSNVRISSTFIIMPFPHYFVTIISKTLNW